MSDFTTPETFTFTKEQAAQAFTEWDRRFREDPLAFANIAEELLFGNPETYGEECAPYFLSLLREIS